MFDDTWFQELPPEIKCLWFYICAKCDNAGVWKRNERLAEFQIGSKIDFDSVVEKLNAGKERIRVLETGDWHLTDFIAFQIGNLGGEHLTNLQKSCKNLLSSYSEKGLSLTGKLPVVIGYRYKGKGKGKGKKESNKGGVGVKEKEKTKTTDFGLKAAFDDVWASYPRRLGKNAAERHFRASVRNPEDLANLKKAIANYCRQIQERKTETNYIKHGSTFFNNWQDYIELFENEQDPQKLKDLARLKKVLGRDPYPPDRDGSYGAVPPADTPELRAARSRSDMVMTLTTSMRGMPKDDPDRAWWRAYVGVLISPAEKDKSPEKIYSELVALGGAPKINLLDGGKK